MKLNVCNECMQIINGGNCYCKDRVLAIKKIGLVNGCININNGKRCKEKRMKHSFLCKEHTFINEPLQRYLESLFSHISKEND